MQDGKSRGPGKDEAWLDRTQQLDGPVLTPGAPPVAGVKLVCVGGPLNGKEFPLTQLELVLGRTSESSIVLPDNSVSRRHAQLRRTPSGWAVSNLSAREGALVNGYPVKAGEQRVLRAGDILTLGTTALMLVEPSPGPEDGESTAGSSAKTAQLAASARAPAGSSDLENRTVLARPTITQPEMEPHPTPLAVPRASDDDDDPLANRTVLDGSAPADLDALENRTVLNGSAPADLDALENRTVLDGRYRHTLPPGSARGPVPAPPPLPMRQTLVPLDDRMHVNGQRGMAGPPPEHEVTTPDVPQEVPPESQTRAEPAVNAAAFVPDLAELPDSDVPEHSDPRHLPWSTGSTGVAMQAQQRTARHSAGRGRRRDAELRKWRLKIVMLGVLALFLGIAPVVWWNAHQAERARQERLVRETRARHDALFEQGQLLLRGGKYEEARAKFLELREQAPDFAVKEPIARAEREIALRNVLDTARTALGKDRLGEAMIWLRRVPEETDQVAELRRLRDAVVARARARVRDAREALAAQNPEEAVRICDDVLVALPGDADATSVRASALAKRQ